MRVDMLLAKGSDPNFPDLHAQPDFVIPWLPDNKDERLNSSVRAEDYSNSSEVILRTKQPCSEWTF